MTMNNGKQQDGKRRRRRSRKTTEKTVGNSLSAGRERWLLITDEKGRIKKGHSGNLQGGPTGPKNINRAVQNIMRDSTGEYLQNVYNTALNEFAARNAALYVMRERIEDYLELCKEVIEARMSCPISNFAIF